MLSSATMKKLSCRSRRLSTAKNNLQKNLTDKMNFLALSRLSFDFPFSLAAFLSPVGFRACANFLRLLSTPFWVSSPRALPPLLRSPSECNNRRIDAVFPLNSCAYSFSFSQISDNVLTKLFSCGSSTFNARAERSISTPTFAKFDKGVRYLGGKSVKSICCIAFAAFA